MYSWFTDNPLIVTSPFPFVITNLPFSGNPYPVNLYLTVCIGVPVPCSVLCIFILAFTSSSTFTVAL